MSGSHVPALHLCARTGECLGPFYPFGCWHELSASFLLPLSPPPGPAINHSLLRFCFFGFDGLRFDGSSPNRLGGHRGCGRRLLFSLFLAGTGGVSQRFGGFARVAVHLGGLATYLFALLLFGEEALRGLKNLCSLLCQHLGPNVLWLSPLPTALFFMSCSAFSAAWA